MVDHGKVILEGTPEYVFEQHDLLTECGLEAPQANMLIKMMKDNGIDIDTAGILDPEKAADAIFKALNKKKESNTQTSNDQQSLSAYIANLSEHKQVIRKLTDFVNC
jgi:hypothetical protein